MKNICRSIKYLSYSCLLLSAFSAMAQTSAYDQFEIIVSSNVISNDVLPAPPESRVLRLSSNFYDRILQTPFFAFPIKGATVEDSWVKISAPDLGRIRISDFSASANSLLQTPSKSLYITVDQMSVDRSLPTPPIVYPSIAGGGSFISGIPIRLGFNLRLDSIPRSTAATNAWYLNNDVMIDAIMLRAGQGAKTSISIRCTGQVPVVRGTDAFTYNEYAVSLNLNRQCIITGVK